jgi:PKD repeat protein
MKKALLLKLCLSALFCLPFLPAGAQTVRCATMEMDSLLRSQQPDRETMQQFEDWMDQAIQEAKQHKVIGGVYQIPVVVHVIHSGEAIGSGTNVSQAAIQSQIDVLNEDFRRILGSNGYNTHPDGADTQIEFCLAQRRPDGSAFAAGAPGVNRILYSSITATAPPYSTNFIDATIKPWTYNNNVATATRGWDPNKYMNIWLCNISGGILGYAQFPQSPLGGMGCGTPAAATDGVVFLYNSIGKSSVTGFAGPYNEGRTATHEIGHWLGLRHIWGDGGCNVDDFCNDTPEAADANYGCPAGTNSCTAAPDAGPDMIENYMDYTDDLCMNIFTKDQKARMRAVLEGSPMRLSLINSDACTPPNPNDAAVTDIFAPKGDQCAGAITPGVQLRNRGSSNLTSATISYRIDNGAPVSFSWTGSLTPGSSATVALPAFTAPLGVHTFKAYSTLPNGAADPSTAYDTSAIQFVVSNGIMPNYTQDFESGNFPPDIKWTVDNPNSDCFEWTAASGISSSGTFNNSIAELPFFGNINTTQNENLITPVFILPCNATAASLQFKVAYRKRVNASNDRLIVEISQDCGTTWTATGYDKAGTTLATSTTLSAAAYFPLAATDWRTETIDLSSYVTTTSKNIRFRFRGVSNNGNNVFIDDIQYSATTPGEINVVQSGAEVLDGGYYNFGSSNVGSASTAIFTVQNTGTTNLTLTGPVTVTGTGFALGSTFGGTTVAPGATTTFSLTFNPGTTGQFTGNVSFGTNDCDEGTYNFQLSGTGAVTPPVADFSANPTTVCSGASVAFTNLSTGATSYSWNFGASATPSTSTAANPTVVFPTAGTYSVTLTATNAFGTDVETKTNYITVLNGTGAALPLTQGFAAATFPPAGWSILNANSSATWVRTTAAGAAPTAGNSMMFDNFNINDATDDEVRILPVSTVGMVSAQLTFDVAYAPYDATNFDGLEVLVSTNCGVSYTSVYSKSATVLATAAATTSAFTPTAAQWRNETVSLTPYIGQGSVIVAFRNLSGYGNRLFVDNINITGVTGTPAPAASFTASPTNVCAGQSVAFTNTSTNSPTLYSWSFPGGTPSTSTAANPTVTYATAGTFNVSLTATNSGGSNTSTQTNYITVNAIPAAPTVSAGGPTTFCTGGSVVLTSSSATGNLWSNGATTQSITVTASGTYSVSVTSGGCTSASSAGTTVTVNPIPAAPTVSAGGPTTFCSGGSVVLTSSSATGNLWSNGATTQSITVTASGTYSVSVTSGGCTSPSSAGTTVTVNPIPAAPTVSAGGPTTFCTGGNVVLTSSSATGNLWSNGATTQSITVTAGGTYTVSVTSGGCTSVSSAGTTVTVNPIPAAPSVSAGGPTTFCSGGSVVLTSSSATGNVWSNGATTQSITVTANGTYTVSVTSGGCTSASSAGTVVTVNPLPVITAGTISDPTACASATGSIQITGSGPGTLSWTGTSGGSQAATLPAIIANITAGTYSVTFTNSTGCVSNVITATLSDPGAPATPVVTAAGPATFCDGGSVTLTSSSASGNVWSTGETTQSITVSESGTYSAHVNVAGCASGTSAAIIVTVNEIPPTPSISASGPLTFCEGGSVTLTSSSATGNAWSSGSSASSVNVIASGTYTLNVTANGCTSDDASVTVIVHPNPVVSFGALADMCIYNNPVVLAAGSPAGGAYSGNGVASGSFDPAAAGAGTSILTYTITDANGCTGSATSSVTVSQCLGVEEYAAGLMLFPNPSEGAFTIVSEGEELVAVSVYDNAGRLVMQRSVSGKSESIDLSGDAGGVYTIEVTTTSSVRRIPLMIRR